MTDTASVLTVDTKFEDTLLLARTSRVRSQRKPGRWVAAAVVAFILVFAIQSVATNAALRWDVVGKFFTNGKVIDGLYLTIWLTVVVSAFAFVLGTLLATMRLSSNPVLRSVSWTYIWIFRSVPLLVQLLFWFNIGYLYPKVSFGIPWGPTFLAGDANSLISATAAAIIGLTLHDAAYATEIVRGGFLSVDQGQIEAAQALALPRRRILLRILLPQAMRSIIPAGVNLVTGTLKATAIVSVISVQDLLFQVETIYSANLLVMPLLVVASIWYLVATSVLTLLQYFLERHFARGALRQLPQSPWDRMKHGWRLLQGNAIGRKDGALGSGSNDAAQRFGGPDAL
jgi:polar amino acid transport system permease protein